LWTGKVSQDASIQLQSLCSQLEYSDQQRTLAVVLMQSNSTSAASTYASAVQTVTSTLKAVNAMTRGAATALVQTNSGTIYFCLHCRFLSVTFFFGFLVQF
jgi:hypothetical protein